MKSTSMQKQARTVSIIATWRKHLPTTIRTSQPWLYCRHFIWKEAGLLKSWLLYSLSRLSIWSWFKFLTWMDWEFLILWTSQIQKLRLSSTYQPLRIKTKKLTGHGYKTSVKLFINICFIQYAASTWLQDLH